MCPPKPPKIETPKPIPIPEPPQKTVSVAQSAPLNPGKKEGRSAQKSLRIQRSANPSLNIPT